MRRSQIPNAITIGRMIATPALIALAIIQYRTVFEIILVAALISDVADGAIARRMDVVSSRGALLDSVADTLLVLATLAGIGAFEVEVFEQDGMIIALCAVVWVLANLAALVRFGKPASLHTRAARIGMVCFYGFVLTLFFYGYYPALLYTVAAVSIAAIEQLLLIALLSEWTPDMRVGIVDVVRQRTNLKK